MTDLDDPSSQMTFIHVKAGTTLAIELQGASLLKNKYPEPLDAIVECSAFVNWRRVDVGEPAVTSLCMHDL